LERREELDSDVLEVVEGVLLLEEVERRFIPVPTSGSYRRALK
jgi:hypothetical protein